MPAVSLRDLHRHRIWHVLAAAGVVATIAAGARSAAHQSGATELLQRGSDYLAAYAPKLSGVLLDEEYVLIQIGGRGMQTPERISSHVVLLDLYGKVMALRDVFAVGGAATRPRTPRISDLLAKPTAEAWKRAHEFAEAGQHYFLRDLVIRVSEPTLALQYLSANNQPRFRWKLEGRRQLHGRELTALGFNEPVERNRQFFLNTLGNAASSGRFLIDPATGTIHRTELWLESKSETARIEVTYALDATLNLWLPAESGQTFDMREPGGGSNAMGGSYDLRHSIQGTATYKNPRYSPIDLSRMTR